MSAASPDFVTAYRALMLDGIAREVETTKKVIAAVPDGKRDYRPDPHARTAWELAWHIATTDVEFLDGIADLKFTLQEGAGTPAPANIAEMVAWYDREMKRGIERVRAMTSEQLTTPVDFLGLFNMPAGFYLAF